MTGPAVHVIEARARAAQTGRWPTDVRGLARLLTRSTATRAFVTHARADVLWLVAELRRCQKERGGA